MSVLVIVSLDTCSDECTLVRTALSQAGVNSLILDVSLGGLPPFAPDHSLRALISLSGRSQPLNPQAWATCASREALALVKKLHGQGSIAGVLAVGNEGLAMLLAPALSALPFGMPKIFVLTSGADSVRSFAGLGDLQLFQSAGGVSAAHLPGRTVLSQAARSLAGMLQFATKSAEPLAATPVLAVSESEFTAAGAALARVALAQRGLQVLGFQASGVGGQTLEWFVRTGALAGVLDLTLAELADEKWGGERGAGLERLTACAVRGIPQVICLGGLDGVLFPCAERVPESWRNRRREQLKSGCVIVRTSPKENDELGKEIAHKASASPAPTVVLVPQGGLSCLDRPGEPFWWPEADAALFQSLRNWMSPHVRLIERDLHIEELAFIEEAVERLVAMVCGGRASGEH